MILETKRLLLREMIPDDFQALLRVLGDPETMCHYSYTFDGQHVRKTHVSVTTREEWLNELTENMISWAEDKIGSKEYAGWCLSFIEDSLEKNNVIEIFGGDTAKESALLYADGMRKGILENNVRAKRLYDRPGEIPNLYRSGVTEYMMAKDLKSD